MAKSRTIATNLSRVFDSSEALIYVVSIPRAGTDSVQKTPKFPTIVYANEACLNWVDVDFLDLKDAALVYSGQTIGNPVENRIRGLAPPCLHTDSPTWDAGFPIFASWGANGRGANERGENNKAENKMVWRLAAAKMIAAGQGSPTAEYWLVVADPPDLDHPATLEQGGPLFSPSDLHSEISLLNRESSISHSLTNLVGFSPFAHGIRRSAQVAIRTPQLDMLIVGPDGSGREHLARTLFHERNGDSPDARLVPIHCAIADQQLVQQNIKELATNLTPGQPLQDCLLLLDVDQLSLAAQRELVGFLQLTTLRIQTIATSTQPLDDLPEFDPMLAQLLGTLVIKLRSLAERMEDVPLLAQAFLEQHNSCAAKQVTGFTGPALQMLLDYDWPGNLDQLLEHVTRAAQKTGTRLVCPDDFPPTLKQGIRALQLAPQSITKINLTDYLEKIESELIVRALTQTGGNKTQASKLLHISRPRLLRRLKQLELTAWMEIGPEAIESDQVDPSAFEEAEE